jgi:hypothetical protein
MYKRIVSEMPWFRLYIYGVVWVLIVWCVVGVWRLRRRSWQPGSALLDSMELLHSTRERAAIELIQQEITGYRDPEDKDGDLPQLEQRAGC